MGQVPDSTKSVSEGSSVNEVQLNEASWQKWVAKGKAQDIARRKRFFLALWFLVPAALVVLGIWALVLRP